MGIQTKAGLRCQETENYDASWMTKLAEVVGCRPVYWNSIQHLVPCTSREDMLQFYNMIGQNIFSEPGAQNRTYLINPPCREIQKVDIDYSDAIYDNDLERSQIIQEFADGNHFGIRLTYRYMKRFKEIKQTKAYTIQSLIGNAGGYVGLYLGYTVLELPLMVMAMIKGIKLALSPGNQVDANVQTEDNCTPEANQNDTERKELITRINHLEQCFVLLQQQDKK